MLWAFEAARRSGYRTWFFFPWLDPHDQMTQFTRIEIIRKINWLYNNVGAVRAVVDGLAREEVDTGIWPVPRTSNPFFNTAVKEAFLNDCGDARFFDEAAIENYHTQQLAIRRNIYLYGELFGQLLRPGQGSKIPTLHTIPSWQVANDSVGANSVDSTGSSVTDWVDGTRANKFGRVFLYRAFIDSARNQYADVPAEDMLHFHDPFWKGQRRGMSCLAAVAMKLFSVDDIYRAANTGELIRQRIAYQITRGNMDDDEPTIVPGAEKIDTIEVDQADGTTQKLHIQRIISQDGADVDIADLPPGRKLEMVESAKGSDAIKWSEFMLSDVAMATPYPPEYVFNLGGVSQGTVYRGIQKRVQRAKNIIRHMQIKPQFCSRWYDFWLWQTILGGRYDDVEGGVPKDWFKKRMNFPADDSVDVGREGALMDDRVDSGKITLSDYNMILGGDAEDKDSEIIADRVRRLKMIDDARDDLRNDPDYVELADDPQLSYEMIFRESKVGVTIRETTTQPTLEEESDTADTVGGNGAGASSSRNGSRM